MEQESEGNLYAVTVQVTHLINADSTAEANATVGKLIPVGVTWAHIETQLLEGLEDDEDEDDDDEYDDYWDDDDDDDDDDEELG